ELDRIRQRTWPQQLEIRQAHDSPDASPRHKGAENAVFLCGSVSLWLMFISVARARRSRCVSEMQLRSLALEPERAPVLAKRLRRRGVYALGQVEFLLVPLVAQRGEHALARERRFSQPDAAGVVDGIGDGRNRGRERAFAGFFRAKGPFRVHAL